MNDASSAIDLKLPRYAGMTLRAWKGLGLVVLVIGAIQARRGWRPVPLVAALAGVLILAWSLQANARESLEGNLCRCTGYQNIVASILDAAGQMATKS